MAAAEQFGRGPRFLADRRGIELGAGPDPAGAAIVGDQHPDRTVGPGLQDEAAFELERGAEQHGEHDGLAEQLGDRGRIGVAAQDVVERRPEPHHPAAQIERRHFERQDHVVDRLDGGFARGEVG